MFTKDLIVFRCVCVCVDACVSRPDKGVFQVSSINIQ